MKHTLETYKKTLDSAHLEKFKYISIDRRNGKTYVNYICPIHGIKTQEINSHKNGYGCIDCAMEAKKELCEKNNIRIEYINYFDSLENKLIEILKEC